jgi:hypothetical protein
MEIALGGGASTYFEYGWVCAPNAAGLAIPANTLTTVTLDTEVSDSSGTGSVALNRVTLPSGTYYWEAQINLGDSGAGSVTNIQSIALLYNFTDSTYVTRSRSKAGKLAENMHTLNGQFTISASKAFELQVISAAATNVGDIYDVQFTLATAGLDQRATFKAWKLA